MDLFDQSGMGNHHDGDPNEGKDADETEHQAPDIDIRTNWREYQAPNGEDARVAHVGFTMDEALKNYFTRSFPGVRVVPGPFATPHSHARLAFERSYGETIVMGMVRNLLVSDIGGNARRNRDKGRSNVHCCCPVLSPEDAVRVSRYQGLQNWCPNMFQKCELPCDIYTAIHSIYYLSPEDVVFAVKHSKQHRLYSLHHTFPDAYGSFAEGEAQYMIDPQMLVTMYSSGNVTPYHHPALFWLNAGYYESLDGQSAIAWSIIQTLPNSVIVLFTPAPVGLPHYVSGFQGFVPTMRDTTYYGVVPLTGAAFHSALQSTTSAPFVNTSMEVDTLFSWGKFMIGVDAGQVEVCIVPKGFVDEMASWMVLKPRDPTTLSSLIAHARMRIKEYNIPPKLVPKAIIFGVALGYTIYLETESRVIATTLSNNKHHFPVINSLLKMELPCRLPAWSLALLATPFLLPLLKWRNRYTASIATLGLLAQLWSVLKIMHRYRMPLPSEQFLDAMKLRDDTHHNFTMPDYGPIPLQGNVMVLGTVCEKPLKPLHPIFVGGPTPVLKNNSMEDSLPKYSLTGVGILVPELIPNINANTASNDLRALLNRGLDVKAYPIPLYDEIMDQFIDNNFDTIFVGYTKAHLVYNFSAWNERFPSATKLRHCRVFANSQGSCEDERRALKLKSFSKMEMLLNSSMTEYKESDPRLIQGGQDEYNVMCGPWVWAFSKALAKVWGCNNPIFYTAGSTAEVVGQWFGVTGHNNVRYKVSETDFSRYDSTQSRSKLLRTVRVMRRFGVPPEICRLMTLACKRIGATNNGICYGIDGTMASGRPETSCGNSLNNGFDTLLNLQLQNSEIPFRSLVAAVRLAVLGDDNVLIREATLAPLSSICYANAGLKSELIERPNSFDATFCSSRFWPTDTGIVLGPKPSRVIAKLGWIVNAPTDRATNVLKSKLLSLEDSCRFVPPLNVIIQHNKRLLTATKRMDRGFDKSQIPVSTVHAPVDETWHMLDYLYEWTSVDQARLVCMLDKVISLPCVLTGDVFQKFLIADGEFPLSANGSMVSPSSLSFTTYALLYLLGPLIEEILKRTVVLNGAFGKYYPIFEFLLYVYQFRAFYGLRTIVLIRLPALVLHYVLASLPLKWGYGLHLLFNVVASTMTTVLDHLDSSIPSRR
jgi:hypothetical protein